MGGTLSKRVSGINTDQDVEAVPDPPSLFVSESSIEDVRARISTMVREDGDNFWKFPEVNVSVRKDILNFWLTNGKSFVAVVDSLTSLKFTDPFATTLRHRFDREAPPSIVIVDALEKAREPAAMRTAPVRRGLVRVNDLCEVEKLLAERRSIMTTAPCLKRALDSLGRIDVRDWILFVDKTAHVLERNAREMRDILQHLIEGGLNVLQNVILFTECWTDRFRDFMPECFPGASQVVPMFIGNEDHLSSALYHGVRLAFHVTKKTSVIEDFVGFLERLSTSALKKKFLVIGKETLLVKQAHAEAAKFDNLEALLLASIEDKKFCKGHGRFAWEQSRLLFLTDFSWKNFGKRRISADYLICLDVGMKWSDFQLRFAGIRKSRYLDLENRVARCLVFFSTDQEADDCVVRMSRLLKSAVMNLGEFPSFSRAEDEVAKKAFADRVHAAELELKLCVCTEYADFLSCGVEKICFGRHKFLGKVDMAEGIEKGCFLKVEIQSAVSPNRFFGTPLELYDERGYRCEKYDGNSRARNLSEIRKVLEIHSFGAHSLPWENLRKNPDMLMVRSGHMLFRAKVLNSEIGDWEAVELLRVDYGDQCTLLRSDRFVRARVAPLDVARIPVLACAFVNVDIRPRHGELVWSSTVPLVPATTPVIATGKVRAVGRNTVYLEDVRASLPDGNPCDRLSIRLVEGLVNVGVVDDVLPPVSGHLDLLPCSGGTEESDPSTFLRCSSVTPTDVPSISFAFLNVDELQLILVTSPLEDKFCAVRLLEFDDQLRRLEDALTKAYDYVVGAPTATHSAGAAVMTPAIVLERANVDRVARSRRGQFQPSAEGNVFLFDYGFWLTVEEALLRPLHKNFLVRLPAQAIFCTTPPNGNSTEPDFVEECVQVMVLEKLPCEIEWGNMTERKQRYVVEFLNDFSCAGDFKSEKWQFQSRDALEKKIVEPGFSAFGDDSGVVVDTCDATGSNDDKDEPTGKVPAPGPPASHPEPLSTSRKCSVLVWPTNLSASREPVVTWWDNEKYVFFCLELPYFRADDAAMDVTITPTKFDFKTMQDELYAVAFEFSRLIIVDERSRGIHERLPDDSKGFIVFRLLKKDGFFWNKLDKNGKFQKNWAKQDSCVHVDEDAGVANVDWSGEKAGGRTPVNRTIVPDLDLDNLSSLSSASDGEAEGRFVEDFADGDPW